MALRPAVLLFDEPCSALDPVSAGVIEGRYTILLTNSQATHVRLVLHHRLGVGRLQAE